MVVYLSLDGQTHCLVLGRQRSVLRALPTAPILDLVAQLRRDLRARSMSRGTRLAPMLHRAVENSLARLDSVLVRPIASLLDAGVVIAPTRGLISVPWGLLPSLRERPVTVAPSLDRWTHAAERSIGSVLALAGPGVARAVPEVRQVAKTWKDMGARAIPEATASDLSVAFQAATVVHVAAHGRHEDQSPMFSSLWMQDGPLFAHELGNVHTRHAVLSACDVGRSHVRPGHEPLGLTMALLSLGVQSVLAPVSPVSDESAAEGMAIYHRALASGQAASLALAQVRSKVPDLGFFTLYGADW